MNVDVITGTGHLVILQHKEQQKILPLQLLSSFPGMEPLTITTWLVASPKNHDPQIRDYIVQH